MLKFTQIPDKLQYPLAVKGQLSTLHSSVITYVASHFKRTLKYRQSVLDAMNTLSYLVVSGDHIPADWSESDPLNIHTVDETLCKEVLGNIFLEDRKLHWDVSETDDTIDTGDAKRGMQDTGSTIIVSSSSQPVDIPSPSKVIVSTSAKLTAKSDLYLRAPTVPQFDVSQPWRTGVSNGELLVIYKSLPEVPRKQNEISVTTDPSLFTDADYIHLYPNHFIQTRWADLYSEVPGIKYHPDLGLILPIDGFTEDEVIDNIIKYPHFFKLHKVIDGQLSSFYKTIEIDGHIHPTLQIWDSLPESKVIPRYTDLVKEYVIRRYLLERDLKKIDHTYKMHGTLDPYLTLFTTPAHYSQLGYTDVLSLAKQCVAARISYKQSRNPILRRLDNA